MAGYIAIIGLVAMVGTAIFTIQKAFKESFVWGIIAIFSGTLAYAIHCWWEDRRPAVFLLISFSLFLFGAFLGEP